MEDIIYVERSNGKWTAWTNTEQGKHYFDSLYTLDDVYRFAHRRGYRVIEVQG